MAPDLNSLPPSPVARPRTISNAGDPSSPSRRSSTVSLQAAATINAGMQNQDAQQRSSPSSTRARGSPQLSRPAERRRSNVAMSLNLNDPAMPAPGELLQGGITGRHPSQSLFRTNSQGVGTSPGHGPALSHSGDPHHHQRTPSLGELHQELEQEQEAQVNRLLQMIRQQQAQLAVLQNHVPSSALAIDDSAPTSATTNERTPWVANGHPAIPSPVGTVNSLPGGIGVRARSPGHRASNELSRRSSYRSRRSSRDSPGVIQPLIAGLHEEAMAGSRDEVAYYQAETQALTRENQMLKVRIRELERQLNESTQQSSNPATPTTGPTHSSSLSAPPLEPDQSDQLPAPSMERTADASTNTPSSASLGEETKT